MNGCKTWVSINSEWELPRLLTWVFNCRLSPIFFWPVADIQLLHDSNESLRRPSDGMIYDPTISERKAYPLGRLLPRRGGVTDSHYRHHLPNLLVSSAYPFRIVFFFFHRPSRPYQWKDPLKWFIYPGLYALVSMLRGALTGFYPYWFFNPSAEQGIGSYGRVFLFVILVFFVFSMLGLGMVMAHRKLSSSRLS